MDYLEMTYYLVEMARWHDVASWEAKLQRTEGLRIATKMCSIAQANAIAWASR